MASGFIHFLYSAIIFVILFVPNTLPAYILETECSKAIKDRNPDTQFKKTQDIIVDAHNFYRAIVEPTASNMLAMTWYKPAHEKAQKWADSCKYLIRANATERKLYDQMECGQNILVSKVKMDWIDVITAWYKEHVNFTYGSWNNDLKAVANYKQMVLYISHHIGCGFTYCSSDEVEEPFFNYVCNYCPMGRHFRQDGRPYTAGKSCEECPKSCINDKLCSYNCLFDNYSPICSIFNLKENPNLCKVHAKNKFYNEYCQASCKCPDVIE